MLNTVLLQAGGDASGAIMQVVMMVGIIGVFYFFMIRPQQKKAKDQKSMIDNLQSGDQVVTIGGLHGKVHSVEETTVILDTDKGVKLTFEKSAIGRKI